MNMNDQIVPDISEELTDVQKMLGKIKRNKVQEPELTMHETKKEILTNLMYNAAYMYASKFKPRKPANDYRFSLQELSDGFYELSAQRIKSPTQTELSHRLYEYLNTNDLDLEESRYYIRNKMYCFIHYIYQFHNGEKYGRDGS